MTSLKESINRPRRFNIILLGTTGHGKSASGNTLLGRKVFISKTQEVQSESVTCAGVTLKVYDTPGLLDQQTSNEKLVTLYQSFLQLDESACTVILLVMKAERVDFEENQAVCGIADVIPAFLAQNTWVLFTKGDELQKKDLTIEQFIEETEGVNEILKRFQNRYHVFNNSSHNPNQVTELIKKIKEAPENFSVEMGFSRTTPLHPEQDPLHRRILLVGKTGVGKSATGNTILGENKFKSALGSSSVTLKCELHQAVVSGKNITVIDTPGLFDTKICSEELEMEIGSSIYLSSPGPHAFLYVQPVNIRFTEQEEKIFPKLDIIFGQEMKKYTMILFTYGDLLEKESVEELIQKNRSLHNLVAGCGGFHIFNNKQLGHREQVSELLEKIDRMVEKNGGTCYSNQMYEEAMSLRQDEEEQVRKEMEERERREEKEGLRKVVEKRQRGEETEILRKAVKRERREETEILRKAVKRERREETERLRKAVEERERREETERLRKALEERERREETERLRKAVKRERREETERLRQAVEERERERERREETERLRKVMEKRERERREERERLRREIRARQMKRFCTRNSSYLHYSSVVAREEQSGLGFKWVVGIGLLICAAAGLIITKGRGLSLPFIGLQLKKLYDRFRF